VPFGELRINTGEYSAVKLSVGLILCGCSPQKADSGTLSLSQAEADRLADEIAQLSVGIHPPVIANPESASSAYDQLTRKLMDSGYIYIQGGYGEGNAIRVTHTLSPEEALDIAIQIEALQDDRALSRDARNAEFYKLRRQLNRAGYDYVPGGPSPQVVHLMDP
jgi:hypothetical protein